MLRRQRQQLVRRVVCRAASRVPSSTPPASCERVPRSRLSTAETPLQPHLLPLRSEMNRRCIAAVWGRSGTRDVGRGRESSGGRRLLPGRVMNVQGCIDCHRAAEPRRMDAVAVWCRLLPSVAVWCRLLLSVAVCCCHQPLLYCCRHWVSMTLIPSMIRLAM